MTPSQVFWSGLAALAAALIANLGVRSLRDFSRHDLEEVCRKRGKPGLLSEVLQQYEQVGLGAEIAATLLASLALVLGMAWIALHWQLNLGDGWPALLATAILLGLCLVLVNVWVARAVARVGAEELIYRTWPVWRVLALLMAPLTAGARLVEAALHRLFGRKPHSDEEERLDEEIRTIVSEGHREGLLEEEAREMIEGVIDLRDADVAEIMTPRTELHMLSVNLDWQELVAAAIETGHTRIPVYEKHRDDIIGILYVKDLLSELATGNPDSRTPIREFLRKPVFVPETKPVRDLLQMLQQMRTHIAVVLDEYGGVSGIVTIEDVLEEIVGEIVDEYDEEVAEKIRPIDDRTCEALGKTHVDEINQCLQLHLPEDGDFDTIGGFVFSELGRVPLKGESFVWQEQVAIEVLEVSKRRIERVRVQRIEVSESESA